jgi:hypothetical protein
VALIPESVADANGRDDVVYLPVVDASLYTVAIVWSANPRSPHVARFVQAVTDRSLAQVS